MFSTRALHLQPLVNILMIVTLVLPYFVPVQSQLTTGTAAQEGALRQEETLAEQLVTAADTFTVEINAISPEMLEATVGDVVTFVNSDSRSRTILLSYERAESSNGPLVYLPLIHIPGAARVPDVGRPASLTQPVTNDETTVEERITLAPGQQVERSFPEPAVVTVQDVENVSLSATLLVTPRPLSKQGSVTGQVLSYATGNPIRGARARVLDGTAEAIAGSDGRYDLLLPPGDYTIVLFAHGYTFANRQVRVQPYTPTAVDTVELVPLDETVTAVGVSGGTATNSSSTTSVQFAAGAVDSTKAVRLTVLPVDEMAGDFSTLPGPFTDGKIPVGFVMFEPDGAEFAADAVWTVGTYVPCYYWIEDEARWGEPVDGYVVDLGGGQKGLRATLPHFSAYGFAAPPPPEEPPLIPEPTGPDPNEKPSNKPNEDDFDRRCGSQLNLMSGELCQWVGTAPLPGAGGLPTAIWAKYYSSHLDKTADIRTSLEIRPGAATPSSYSWSYSVAGTSHGSSSGAVVMPTAAEAVASYDVSASWNGTTGGGSRAAPGLHHGMLTGTFGYNTSVSGGGGGGPSVTCPGVCGWSYFTESVIWPAFHMRADLSPFGIGWFGPHDTLLVDNGDWATIFAGSGRYLIFTRQGDGSYEAPPGEFSSLAAGEDGGWTLRYLNGTTLSFNEDGRLTVIEDRYGNFQLLLYEPNGQTVPAGEWGLTARLRRVTDTSGNTFDYAYDEHGWLASLTDSAGRVYRYEHDGDGHLTTVTDPLGNREVFSYDAEGKMTSHTDKRGHETTYVLDDEGRLVSRTWPTGTTLQVAYTETEVDVLLDNGSRLVTTLNENNSPVAVYNGIYEVRITYNDEQLPESDSGIPLLTLYDENGSVVERVAATRVSSEYEGAFDQVSRATSSSGEEIEYGYDAVGNLVSLTNALGETYAFSYDSHGQLLTATDPLGNSTRLEYDDRGLVTRLVDAVGHTWQIGYDAYGNVETVRDAAGRESTLEHDALNRLTRLVDALNGVTGLTYDANGNLTRITDPSGRAMAYSYDSLDRVNRITYPDGNSDTFTYDALGNPTRYTDARGQTIEYGYDAANRLASKLVTGGPGVTYSYDRYDQLTGVSGGLVETQIAYVRDSGGVPLREAQRSATLPLNADVYYRYSNDLVTANALYMETAATAPVGLSAPVLAAPVVASEEPQETEEDCATIISGPIGANLVLDDPTVLTCFSDLTILQGASITVGPGVHFVAAGGDLIVEGTLVLAGEPDNKALLGSLNYARPAYGTLQYQYQVIVRENGHLEWNHARFLYAGRWGDNCVGQRQLWLSGNATAAISDSEVGLEGSRLPVHVQGNASLQVSGSQIGDAATNCSPLIIESAGTVSVRDSMLVASGDSYASVVNLPNVGGLVNGNNQFLGNANWASTQLSIPGGTIVEDTTWAGSDQSSGLAGLHFRFSNLDVQNGATLSIEGPWSIQAGRYFRVGGESTTGHLRLLGTPGRLVTLYYNRDYCNYLGLFVYANSTLYAENTVLDGAAGCLHPSFHNAVLTILAGAEATLVQSLVRNGDGNGIRVAAGGRLHLQESAVHNNRMWGVRAEPDAAGAVSIGHSRIYENDLGGVLNVDPNNRPPIDARHNYWGAASGPSHADNPDAAGQVVSDGVTYAPWSPAFILPGDGRLSSLHLTGPTTEAQRLYFGYDAAGRLASLSASGYYSHPTGLAGYSLGYTYDAAGRLAARTPARSSMPLATGYAYLANGWLQSMTITSSHSFAGTPSDILTEAYRYDAVGNVIQVDSNRDGSTTYTYDPLDRLTGVSGPGISDNYSYDAAGNRLSAGALTFSYDAAGRLAGRSDGTSYSYDVAGNLTSKSDSSGTTAYRWDGEGRLARIDYPGGSYSAYQYDDSGRRVSRRLPDGSTVYYIYAGAQLLQERDADGNVLVAYTYDGLDRPVSMWRGGQSYFYLLDRLGSVIGLVDIHGEEVARYRYDPWGNALESSGPLADANRLRFTSREYDVESGLYFYRARYYDPEVGRFISRDPLGIREGLNQYAYVGNNPANWRDPMGTQKKRGRWDRIKDWAVETWTELNDIYDEYLGAKKKVDTAAKIVEDFQDRSAPEDGLDVLESIGDVFEFLPDWGPAAICDFFSELMTGAVGAVRAAPGGEKAAMRQRECGSINENVCLQLDQINEE
jgi:RHS repeat-associated protein